MGRYNAKIKCYSAQPAKLGQDITVRAYIIEVERYCNWLEKQNAQLKDGFEKKLQKRFAEGKKAGRNQRQKTANAMKVNKNKIIADLRSEVGRLKQVAKVHEKAKKETQHRMKADKNGVIRRTNFWKKRSTKLRAVGINIHGGLAGYEMDIRHQVASSARMIDAFLNNGKVQERPLISLVGLCVYCAHILYFNTLHFRTRLKHLIERDFRSAERTIEAAIVSYVAKRRIRIGRRRADELHRNTTKVYDPSTAGGELKNFSCLTDFFYFRGSVSRV